MKKRKILVTGALGHIGSKLIRAIPQVFPDTEIMWVDNLRAQRYGSLFNLSVQNGTRFLQADVLTADLDALFAGVDVVIHLAAITETVKPAEVNLKNQQDNFLAAQRVSDACVRAGCALIFPSTTSVYTGTDETVDESFVIDEEKLFNPYFKFKRISEKWIQELGKTKGLPFAILRFGTIFGVSPGMAFHNAVNKFCWQACTDQPLTVWQTAWHQKRPYLDVNDAVSAILFVIEKKLFDGEMVNVLTANLTVQSIVETIARYVPDLQVQTVDAEIMNAFSFEVANDRFKKLGFEFKGNLESGIGETVQLFRAHHGG